MRERPALPSAGRSYFSAWPYNSDNCTPSTSAMLSNVAYEAFCSPRSMPL